MQWFFPPLDDAGRRADRLCARPRLTLPRHHSLAAARTAGESRSKQTSGESSHGENSCRGATADGGDSGSAALGRILLLIWFSLPTLAEKANLPQWSPPLSSRSLGGLRTAARPDFIDNKINSKTFSTGNQRSRGQPGSRTAVRSTAWRAQLVQGELGCGRCGSCGR